MGDGGDESAIAARHFEELAQHTHNVSEAIAAQLAALVATRKRAESEGAEKATRIRALERKCAALELETVAKQAAVEGLEDRYRVVVQESEGLAAECRALKTTVEHMQADLTTAQDAHATSKALAEAEHHQAVARAREKGKVELARVTEQLKEQLQAADAAYSEAQAKFEAREKTLEKRGRREVGELRRQVSAATGAHKQAESALVAAKRGWEAERAATAEAEKSREEAGQRRMAEALKQQAKEHAETVKGLKEGRKSENQVRDELRAKYVVEIGKLSAEIATLRGELDMLRRASRADEQPSVPFDARMAFLVEQNKREKVSLRAAVAETKPAKQPKVKAVARAKPLPALAR